METAEENNAFEVWKTLQREAGKDCRSSDEKVDRPRRHVDRPEVKLEDVREVRARVHAKDSRASAGQCSKKRIRAQYCPEGDETAPADECSTADDRRGHGKRN